MLTAAIFDMDGTILDSQWLWHDVGARYLRTLGVTPHPGLNEALAALSVGEGCRYLIRTYGLRQTPEQVEAGIHAQVEQGYREQVQLKPGAGGFLRLLNERDVRLCVVTATPRPLAESALRRCGALGRLDFLLTVDEFGVGKGRPDIFLYAMERLGGTLENTLVFEDAPHAIRTAAEAGFAVVGIQDASAGAPEDIRPLCRDYWTAFPDDEEDACRRLRGVCALPGAERGSR